MKMKNTLLVLPLLMVVFTTGCAKKSITGTGVVKELEYTADNFDELEIKDIYLKDGFKTYGPKVNILPGKEKKITITTDEFFESEIKVQKEGNKKIIKGNRFHALVTDQFDINLYGYVLSDIDLSGACTATAREQCLDKNELDIELSGACTMSIDTYEGVDFSCDLSGASTLSIGECKIGNADFDLSGASEIRVSNLKTTSLDIDLSGASRIDLLAGNANTLSCDVSGASEVKASTFEIETGKVHVSGASSMYITVNQSLTGSASGASTIYYSGEGNVNVNTSGASSVKKVN